MAGGLSAREREGGVTVYLVGQLKIKDRAAYDRYAAAFAGVFAKFNGRLLAADFGAKALEGEWDKDRAVLISFPDEASLMAWINSPDYREIAKDRIAGADALVLLVRGLESS
jgi:uncharacterized protein (DUF1330 family)